jgi:hypothetical protein
MAPPVVDPASYPKPHHGTGRTRRGASIGATYRPRRLLVRRSWSPSAQRTSAPTLGCGRPARPQRCSASAAISSSTEACRASTPGCAATGSTAAVATSTPTTPEHATAHSGGLNEASNDPPTNPSRSGAAAPADHGQMGPRSARHDMRTVPAGTTSAECWACDHEGRTKRRRRSTITSLARHVPERSPSRDPPVRRAADSPQARRRHTTPPVPPHEAQLDGRSDDSGPTGAGDAEPAFSRRARRRARPDRCAT